MKSRSFAAALAAFALAAALPAHATAVSLLADGQWHEFDVNDLDALSFGTEWIDNANTLSPGFGTPLEFTFTVAPGFRGLLTVVDAGFAGDSFRVTNFGALLGSTSAVAVQNVATAPFVGLDFAAALADTRFSRATFTLAPGSYRIGGALAQSVQFDGTPLNATAGGLQLTTVAAVPEPSTWAGLGAGLAVLAAVSRRRGRSTR